MLGQVESKSSLVDIYKVESSQTHFRPSLITLSKSQTHLEQS